MTDCVGEDCTSWAIEDCSHQMCKKCCAKQTMVSDKVSDCKVADHKRKPPALSGDYDVEME